MFRANDQVSPAYKMMSKRANTFGSTSQRAFRKASVEGMKFNSIMKGTLAANAISRSFNIAAMGARSLADEFISFDQAIISTAAKIDGADFGGEKFLQLEKSARQAGATTEFTATEAAKAMNSLAMSSFNAEQIMSALPGAIDLATVSEQGLEFSTQAAVDTLNSFNLMTKDTTDLATNMARVNDVLTKTFTSSSADIVDLAESMKYAGSAIELTGGELEDFAFLAGAIAKAGVRGSMGGTTLRTMFLSLTGPVGKGKKALKQLGITIEDKVTKSMKSPLDIMDQLIRKTSNMGDVQKSAALKAIFGKRAIIGVSKAMSLGIDELTKYRSGVKASTDVSKNMAAKIRQSLQNRLATLKSSVIDLGFTFLGAFKKHFPGGIDAAIAAVRQFDITSIVQHTKDFIDVLGDVYEVTKNVTLAVRDTIDEYKFYWPLIKRIGEALVAYRVAVMIATGAQWLWNVALSANPIGIILVGLLGWISAIYDVVDNWTFLKVTVLEIIDSIDTQFMKLLDNPFFTAIALLLQPWFTIPALIKKHWTPLLIFFELLIDKVQSAVDFVLRQGQSIADYFGIETDLTSFERDRKAEEAASRKVIQEKVRSEGSARYEGKLLIEGAPEGSKLTGKSTTTGGYSDPFEIELFGPNP
jgi:TP901 family phage tail tape measure protein